MDVPGSKVPAQNVVCPLAMQPGFFPGGSDHGEDEFDFREIAKVLLKKKYIILAFAFVGVIVGSVYALSLPNIYMSEVLVIPGKRIGVSGGGEGGSPLASQFGGLASVLGVSIGGAGQESESEVYLAIMHTRPFAEYTIKEFNLMPLLAAEINKKDPGAVKLEEAVNLLLEDMKIAKARKELGTGVRISFSGKSPEFSAKIAETLVKSINRYSQYDTIERANKSIAMANIQLKQTPVAMMQKVLWDIVSQKTMEIILAQAQDDFSFRVIEPAMIPKERIKPQRSSIVVSCAGVGFLIGIMAVLLWIRPSFLKKR